MIRPKIETRVIRFEDTIASIKAAERQYNVLLNQGWSVVNSAGYYIELRRSKNVQNN